MSQAGGETLQAGREAIGHHAWREGFELLQAADAASRLSAEDLEGMADAAWWTGRLGACIDARERAFKLYLDAGNTRRAGYMAITLAREYFAKHESSVAGAWLSRADHLLDGEPECVERAWLLRTRTVIALEGEQDFETATTHARNALAMATGLKDRDLMALTLHDNGRVLLARGQIKEGQALMDEATVAAVAGELSPWVTGAVYCNTITTCQRMADFRRAGEWTEAARRWCERQAIAGFPGMCRVYRAEIMRLRGAWTEAEQEARRACEELREFNLGYRAEAFYEVGEIRLHMGDLVAAGEAFRQANELGRKPQPGISLLRLAEGKAAAALASIKSAVADETRDALVRARLLPALTEIAIEAKDFDAAQTAVAELQRVAQDYGTTALEAYVSFCRGALHLARGEFEAARANLSRSVQLWQDLDAPYEVGKARLLLAEVYRAAGDQESAALELEAARTAFEDLGAAPALHRADELLKVLGHPPRARAGGQTTRTFAFTDIVKSTPLVEAVGDDAWVDIVRWHNETLRRLFAQYGGEEVDHAGDGFFVVFEDTVSGLDCAVAIQRVLADHRRNHGFAPQVRIGVHAATATRQGRTYVGKGVHAAARIGALAEGGEIVASEETLVAAASRYHALNPRTVTLKGISEAVRVANIEWRLT